MNEARKMMSIGANLDSGTLDSLALVQRNMRKQELGEMSEQELKEALGDTKGSVNLTKAEIIEKLLDANAYVDEVDENDEYPKVITHPATQESLDVAGSEPPVNSIKEEELELEEGGRKRTKRRESRKGDVEEESVADRIRDIKSERKGKIQSEKIETNTGLTAGQKFDRTARLIEERLAERERLEREIYDLAPPVSSSKETASISRARLEGGRRIAYQPVTKFPFGVPNIIKSSPSKPEAVKIVAKPLPTPQSIKTERPKPVRLVEELKNPKSFDVGSTVEDIAQGLHLYKEIPPQYEQFAKDHEDEIHARLWQLYHPGEEIPKQLSKASESKPESQKIEQKAEPKIEIENAKELDKGFKLDGNVEFAMGKLGILDVSDPRQIEVKKAETIKALQKEVPNFLTLSPNKQMYVLEKLRQKTERDLDRTSLAESRKVKGLKRLWNGPGTFRKKIITEIKGGGLSSYKENLADITDFVENRGIDIGDGMVLKFVSRKGETEIHQRIIDDFNKKATILAEIPYDETISSRTGAQKLLKSKYEKAKHAYEEARAKFMKYEGSNKEASSKDKRALELSDIEDDIRMNQAITSNLEASTWVGKQIKNYNKLLEKGGYAVAGGLARGMAKYAAGFGGGIIVTAALGGIMGRVRKGKEFASIAADKRYGDFIEAKKGAQGAVREERAGVKEFIDSKGYADRINKLIDNISKAPEGKREALMQSLQNRITVAREREAAGLVRYGNVKEEFRNKFRLVQAMKDAERVVVLNDKEVKATAKTVAERLTNQYFKDKKKDVEKREELELAFWRGARNSTAFFALGFEARDWLLHDGEATKRGWEWLAKTGKESLGDISKFGEISDSIDHISRPAVEHATNTVRINPVSESTPRAGYSFPDTKDTFDAIEAGDKSFTATAGNRGVIGMFDDLQKQIHAEYAGKAMPPQFRDMLSKDPEELAKMFGAYRPGQGAAESMIVGKGATLSFEHNQLVFHDGAGGEQAISPDQGFDGKSIEARHDILNAKPESNNASLPETDTRAPFVPYENHGGYAGAENVVPGHVNEEVVADSATAGEAPAVEIAANNAYGVHGKLDIKYDSFGRVESVSFGTAGGVDEVQKFLASPNKYLVDDLRNSGLKFPTTSFGAHELSAIKPDCAEYLKYKGLLATGQFERGSEEFKFISNQMALFGNRIHEKAGNIFKPLEDDRAFLKSIPGFRTGMKPLEMVKAPETRVNTIPAARPSIIESSAPAQSAAENVKMEIIHGSSKAIDPKSVLFTETAKVYGGNAKIDGDVVFYKDGSIGFYGESSDLSVAQGMTDKAARLNIKSLNLGAMIDRKAVQTPDGTYRFLSVYRKAA